MALKQSFKLLVALKDLKELMDICDEEEIVERRFWVNPFLEKREHHSMEAHLLNDLLWENCEFQNFTRMTLNDFENVLNLVEHKIQKQDTVMRCAISSRVRLAVTLRFIGTGDSYRSLEYLSRVSRKTISKFVPEVLEAIIESFQEKYLKFPSTANEWKSIAKGFQDRWQFPHTLGAIDGKHIRIKAPPHSGSDFYNYKGFFSIVLLGVVDSSSRFIFIDVGGNGRASDVVLFKNCSLYESVKRDSIGIPPDDALPGQVAKTPYFFIGDDIFGLDHFMMKAYNRNSKLTTAQEVFNYRLSRARMTVEMAFGRLAARFRIFHRPLEVDLKTSDLVVKACCILHNYLTKPAIISCTINEADLSPPMLPETFSDLPQQRHETVRFVNEVRDNVKHYLISEGDVPFQWQKIRKQIANPVNVTIE